MLKFFTRLTLGLALLASITVAATAAPVAAATPTMIVSPYDCGDFCPDVQVKVTGFNFLPGWTVYLSSYNGTKHTYEPLGTAKVTATGLLAGTFFFRTPLWCSDTSWFSSGKFYLLVRARTYLFSSYSDTLAWGPVYCKTPPN